MFDLTLQTIFMRAGALVFLAVIQGLAVAAAAVALGDPGPRHDGRLSLAPSRHLDALGGASLILFGLGWSRFVAVDPRRLHLRRAGLAAVAISAAAALVVAAVAFRLLAAPALTTLPLEGGLVGAAFLRTAASLALANAVFGLLPVPPLPGGHLLGLSGLDPPERWHGVLGVVLLILVATGTIGHLIAPIVTMLTDQVQLWSPR